ncbi:uncharacterized protein LOC100917314 isoform X1 [Sarcophilus harrisii]|uniref:uncharacterized protein LOC100917314 isoform X1 n=1 Tax=Sarcophilus harrisii TaxID=9305 RepID=UPI00062BAF3D|nr:uncharacterized protein LOC100917314 isoform X1 [Sarcophilus harrisii]
MAGSQGLLLWGGICFIYFLKIQISSGQEDKLLVATGTSSVEVGTSPSPAPRIPSHSINSGSPFSLRKRRTRNHRIAPSTPSHPPLAPKPRKKPVALYPGGQKSTNSTSHLLSLKLLFESGLNVPKHKMGALPALQSHHPPNGTWKAPVVTREAQDCYSTSLQPQWRQSKNAISCAFWRQLIANRQKDMTLSRPPGRPRHRHGSPLWVGPPHVATLAPSALSHRWGEHNDSMFLPLRLLWWQLATTTIAQPSSTGFLQGQPVSPQILSSITLPHPEHRRSPSSCGKLDVSYIGFGGWRPQRPIRRHSSLNEDLKYRPCYQQRLYKLIASVTIQASPASTENEKAQDTTTSHSPVTSFPSQQPSPLLNHFIWPKVTTPPPPDPRSSPWTLQTATPRVITDHSSHRVRRLINFQDLRVGGLQSFNSSPSRTIIIRRPHQPMPSRPPVTLPPSFALRKRASSSNGIRGPPGLRRGKPIYGYSPFFKDRLSPLVTSVSMYPS